MQNATRNLVLLFGIAGFWSSWALAYLGKPSHVFFDVPLFGGTFGSLIAMFVGALLLTQRPGLAPACILASAIGHVTVLATTAWLGGLVSKSPVVLQMSMISAVSAVGLGVCAAVAYFFPRTG